MATDGQWQSQLKSPVSSLGMFEHSHPKADMVLVEVRLCNDHTKMQRPLAAAAPPPPSPPSPPPPRNSRNPFLAKNLLKTRCVQKDKGKTKLSWDVDFDF